MTNKALFIRVFKVHLVLSLMTAWLVVMAAIGPMDGETPDNAKVDNVCQYLANVFFFPFVSLFIHFNMQINTKPILASAGKCLLTIMLIPVDSLIIALLSVPVRSAVSQIRKKLFPPKPISLA